ncbi:DUF692 family protein [Bacillus cereus]|nr:DUF692 family protein [Bacillus cereus]
MSKHFGPSFFEKIPKYGIGLGLNPSDAHLIYLENIPKLIDFVEVTVASSRDQGPISYNEARKKHEYSNGFQFLRIDDYPSDVKRLVHSTNINPAYPDPIDSKAYEKLSRIVKQTASPWVTEDLGIWLMSERHVYPFFMPLPLTKEALKVTIHNVKKFHSEMMIPFNAEFPPIRVIAGNMHAFDFFRILVEETGCGMCLDIGHILSYQLERNVSPTADLHLLPWHSITELHVAGGNIDLTSDGFHYDDTHGDFDIVTVCYDMMDTAIKLAPNLKAITLEVFGARQPKMTLKKLKSIRTRKVVKEWLENKTESQIQLPTLESSKRKVRESVVAMYDILHEKKEVSSNISHKKNASFLELFASNEQQKWDYERQARIQLQGANLSNYYPLTTQWLIQSKEYPDYSTLFTQILDGLPGTSVSMHNKVTTAFKKLVTNSDQFIAKELYRCETWMNECARDINTQDSIELSIDVLRLMKDLNQEDLLNDLSTYLTPFKLTHLGECRFGRINIPSNLDSDDDQPLRGQSSCCTGK